MIEYPYNLIKQLNANVYEETVEVAMKLMGDITSDTFPVVSDSSRYLDFCKTQTKDFQIIVRSLNYRMVYGYEITPFEGSFVYTPTTDRCFINMFGALATKTGSIINGSQHIGKAETIKVSIYLLFLYSGSCLFAW